ncbi:MAG: hypothetical protein KGL67_01130 [Patescibacteria group bacterium]|nr:hypothetical protein [Patescibacteria group bacterium]
MEPNFQTSFIPKKPMVEEHVRAPRPIGLLTIISIFILFTVLLASGALYFYKGIMTRNIEGMKANLHLAEQRFEPSKITELQKLDKRLGAANQVLSKHIAITPIFQALQAVTMKSVSFTNFSYDFGEGANSKINIKMSGVTLGYSNLALQSDLFAKNKNFINPVFSNLTLNDKGNVAFDLNFSVDPSFVDYKTMLLTENQDNGNPQIPQPGT